MTTEQVGGSHIEEHPSENGSADHPDLELRALVVEAAATSDTSGRALDLWAAIRAGGLIVVDSFSTLERAYLVVQWKATATPSLRLRHWEILERILLGESQKSIGVELDLAASTVATSSKSALRAIGVTSRVSRVPPLLSMLAHASVRRVTPPYHETQVERDGVRYCVLSMALRSSVLAARLSPAEQKVALMRIEGRSLAEIATSRHTSPRTVANQLGTAFRRLGISGRSSLVQYFLLTPASAVMLDASY
jgi:DNA-binding CsgD family transcriptional regulator